MLLFFMEEREKEAFSYNECLMMLKIIEVENSPRLSIRSLANQCKISEYHPRFRHLLTFLRNSHVITEIGSFGPSKIIEIDHKELRNLINEQRLTNVFRDYFAQWHVDPWF